MKIYIKKNVWKYTLIKKYVKIRVILFKNWKHMFKWDTKWTLVSRILKVFLVLNVGSMLLFFIVMFLRLSLMFLSFFVFSSFSLPIMIFRCLSLLFFFPFFFFFFRLIWSKKNYVESERGPTGSRTQVAGFKVQSANHYTIEPVSVHITNMFLFISANIQPFCFEVMVPRGRQSLLF